MLRSWPRLASLAVALVALAGCAAGLGPVDVAAVGPPATSTPSPVGPGTGRPPASTAPTPPSGTATTAAAPASTTVPGRPEPPSAPDDPAQTVDDQDVVARYDVQDGELGNLVAGKDRAKYRSRFERFEQLIPVGVRDEVVSYAVFHPTDDSVAFVSAVDRSNHRWEFGLSDDNRDDQDLDTTILHESAHLVTLGDDQLDTAWRGPCRTWESGDGCLHADAYLYEWVQQFWVDLLPEWDGIEQTSGPRLDDLIEAFYEAHRDRFVRDYAATSPEEDIAESFSAWALNRTPRSPAVAQKMAFFASLPAFQAIKVQATAAGAHR